MYEIVFYALHMCRRRAKSRKSIRLLVTYPHKIKVESM